MSRGELPVRQGVFLVYNTVRDIPVGAAGRYVGKVDTGILEGRLGRETTGQVKIGVANFVTISVCICDRFFPTLICNVLFGAVNVCNIAVLEVV